MKKPVWKVQVFADADDQYELSVVKIGTHGTSSWGWPDDEKLILFDGIIGEDCSQKMYDFLYRHAHMMCADLNFEEGVRTPINHDM